MPRIFRVGVIGCGAMGGRNDSQRGWRPGRLPLSHAGAYRSHPRTELVAAADPDGDRLKEFGQAWEIRSLYVDYRELLSKEALDIVSICAPAVLQPVIVEEAARRGVKALFCEKPLAFDLGDAVRSRDTAVEQGILMLVNYSRRWNRSLQDLAEELRNGTWGEIRRVTVLYPGGIVSNGTHALDLIRWLVDDVTTVQAVGWSRVDGEDGAIDAVCRTKSEIPCVLQTCDPRDFTLLEVDILATRGRVRIVSNGRRVERMPVAPDAHYPAYRLLSPEVDARDTDWEACTVQAVEDLVGCLESGGRPRCGGDEAVEALRVAVAIRQSAQEGGKAMEVQALQAAAGSPMARKPGGR